MLDKSPPLLLEHYAVSKRERIWRNLAVDEKKQRFEVVLPLCTWLWPASPLK